MKTKTLQDFAQDESPKKLRKQKKNKNSEPENKNSKRSTFHRFLPFLSRDKKELIYPVQEFQEDGTVICEYNGEKQIQALFRPTPYDLSKLTDEEFERISNGYWEFHRLYKKQMKEFYINFPENNKDNQSFINEKMKQENDAVKLRFLDYEMQKLKIQEKWVKTRQSFIAVYGKDQEELETRITELQTAGKRLFTFKQLDKKEVLLLFELINNSGKLSEAHRLLKKRQDNEDIVQTAPRGGLIFGANYKYFESGADYRTVLYVSDLPQTKKDFWISGIVNREYVDAATVDYVMNESVNYEKEIAETVENYEDEAAQAKKTVVRDAALKNANELRRLADKMNDIGEIIKTMEIRLYVSGKTLEELEMKVKAILDDVSFEAQPYAGMMLADYQALFIGHDLWKSKFENSFREGIELPAETFGIGFAHNNSYLHDEEAFFYGSTQTGGRVYFDPFAKSKSRLSYAKFIGGSLGSGKSTLLKHLLLDNWMRGNFVYIFDKAGEFYKLVKRLGGAYLYLDGRDGLINLLQVYGLISMADEENVEEDVEGSFNYHLTVTVERFNILYEFKTVNANAKIRQLLKEFYIYFGIYGTKAVKPITQLKNTDYPTFLDFKAYLMKCFAQEADPAKKRVEDDLLAMISEVIEPNARQFIGHTTLDHLLTRQIICFDISMINDNQTDPIYDTLFNVALTLYLNQAQKNGRVEKKAFEQGRKFWNQIKRTEIITDEAHNVLNPQKPYAARSYSTTVAEGRKFFIDVTLATQNITKMLPANSAQIGGEAGQALNDIQNIIGLCQYRFWMKQPPTAVPTLRLYFSDDFREFDYSDIKNYELVENLGSKMMLVGASEKPLIMYHWVSPAELELFEGGA
ncbi:hypothetical protein [Lactovum odontotermitis]